MVALLALTLPAGAGDRYTSEVIPLFAKPFEGEYATSGAFDHQLGDGKRQLTFWGDLTHGKDGHSGWDWPMAVGTSLYAMADGEVIDAATRPDKSCPSPNGELKALRIRHTGPGGEVVVSSFGHVSEFKVSRGDRVKQGQLVAKSGNTGCSSGPHLHLGVYRSIAVGGRRKSVAIDPFGWDGDRPDPLLADDQRSIYLWLPGKAPLLYRDSGGAQAASGPVGISLVRGMGWNDDAHPNNEFVELSAGAGDPFDLSGLSLRNNAGDSYPFPQGTSVNPGKPLRVHSGSGAANPTTLFWGRNKGAWADTGDCVRLVDSDGDEVAKKAFLKKNNCN
jgi:murein DD-endopeptidase MepM/ murein hydrolase activator NlpD